MKVKVPLKDELLVEQGCYVQTMLKGLEGKNVRYCLVSHE